MQWSLAPDPKEHQHAVSNTAELKEPTEPDTAALHWGAESNLHCVSGERSIACVSQEGLSISVGKPTITVNKVCSVLMT